MIKGRIAKFNINPGLYNPFKPSFFHYYTVHVFKEKEYMYRYCNRLGQNEGEDYKGIVIPYVVERYIKEEDKWERKPKIGNVLLCDGYLYSRVISHEAVHMSTHFLRVLSLLKLDPISIDEGEELLAYCIGNCTSEIYSKLGKLGII